MLFWILQTQKVPIRRPFPNPSSGYRRRQRSRSAKYVSSLIASCSACVEVRGTGCAARPWLNLHSSFLALRRAQLTCMGCNFGSTTRGQVKRRNVAIKLAQDESEFRARHWFCSCSWFWSCKHAPLPARCHGGAGSVHPIREVKDTFCATVLVNCQVAKGLRPARHDMLAWLIRTRSWLFLKIAAQTCRSKVL